MAFNVATICYTGGGVVEAKIVAAAVWSPDEADTRGYPLTWDVVAVQAMPAAEPTLKGFLHPASARSVDSIRRFVEFGLAGYQMDPPETVMTTDPTEAARAALLSRGITPYR